MNVINTWGETIHINCARPGGYGRQSALDYCSGGGHDGAADRKGRIVGGWPLSFDERLSSENFQKYGIFWLSSMACQLDRKLCWPPQHRLSIHFKNLSVFKCSTYVFLYAALFMLS